jgi:hypothetical protein
MTDEELDRIIRGNEIARRKRDDPLNRASRAAVATALADHRVKERESRRVAAWLKSPASASYRASESNALKARQAEDNGQH